MNAIIIKHIIEDKKFTINFDLLDGSLSFPMIELNTEGDIDFNLLVIKLTELIEKKRSLEVVFEDTNSILEINPKVQLVKNTLEEIYTLFNKNLDDFEKPNSESSIENDSNNDLPF